MNKNVKRNGITVNDNQTQKRNELTKYQKSQLFIKMILCCWAWLLCIIVSIVNVNGIVCSQYCTNKPRSNCRQTDGKCFECKAGRWGNKCEKKCSKNCVDNSVCGRYDGKCNECVAGTYGIGCDKKCVYGVFCMNKQCDKSSGKCNECPLGKWGNKRCSKKCPVTCPKCDMRNGQCIECDVNTWGSKCNICNSGKWGRYCTKKCSDRCVQSKCSSITGKCNKLIPTAQPTYKPTFITLTSTTTPTHLPTLPTSIPSQSPSKSPYKSPSSFPSKYPTTIPSNSPTTLPSQSPTKYTSHSPTKFPSKSPTLLPSQTPSDSPFGIPTLFPSHIPSSCRSVYEQDTVWALDKCMQIEKTSGSDKFQLSFMFVCESKDLKKRLWHNFDCTGPYKSIKTPDNINGNVCAQSNICPIASYVNICYVNKSHIETKFKNFHSH